jgi:peptidoglycan L-alanyl-D-glutamate endopeptidase CwlK
MDEGLERIDTARLHPEVLRRVGRVLTSLRARGHRFVASAGYRSFTEQQQLFAQGRGAPGPIVTRARPGYSAHNWGLAVDLVHDQPAPPREEQLRLLSESAGIEGLDRNVTWSMLADGPHLQLDLDALQVDWNDFLTVSADGDLEPVWTYLSGRIEGL